MDADGNRTTGQNNFENQSAAPEKQKISVPKGNGNKETDCLTGHWRKGKKNLLIYCKVDLAFGKIYLMN